MNEELAFTPATELLALIRSGEVSPVELMQLYLNRIERFNPQLVAYLSVADDAAIVAARAAEDAVARGDEPGPLHGLPIPIKESQNAAGMSATLGSVVFHNRVAEVDSAVVERLRQAGAIILGKTNLSEFGIVGTCENTVSDLGRNPWNLACTPGGQVPAPRRR